MSPIVEIESAEAKTLNLSRFFAAPRSLVFRIWTDARYVALWWGVEGATNPICEMDVRPGGSWRINMRTAGGTLYPNGGEYLEVIENERLVYTDIADASSPAWGGSPPGTAVHTVTFRDEGCGTRVRIHIRFSSAEDLNRLIESGFEDGLGQGFDRFERLVASVLGNPDALSSAGFETPSARQEEAP